MRVERAQSSGGFLDAAGAWLTEDEVTNALLLSVATGGDDGTLRAVVRHEDGHVVAAAAMMPLFDLVLSDGPRLAMRALAEDLYLNGPGPPGCLGPSEAATTFAETYAAQSRQTPQMWRVERIYALETVTWPSMPPGEARLAAAADEAVLAQWALAFDVDTGEGPGRDAETALQDVREATAAGRLWCWWDGEPVSMAHWGGETANTVRIGGVYTPPERRGTGYASALVATLSERMLGRGKRWCVLYTDVSNATSNAMYERIGYRPVRECGHWSFAPR